MGECEVCKTEREACALLAGSYLGDGHTVVARIRARGAK